MGLMRVLIAALHPPGGRLKIGGVQSWSATVGAELTRRGHEVTFWGPDEHLDGMFDVGIFANTKWTGPALKMCVKSLVVSHGIIEAEKPIGTNLAFTSEEVRDHWNGYGPIIRQPIDLSFWRPAKVKKPFLARFSYRGGLDFLPGVSAKLGLRYIHVQKESHEVARDILQQSAVVVATGRGACEAMACGASVVICDDRGYQAPLLDPDTLGSMNRNYSGRSGITPTAENVLEACHKAIEAGSLRGHAEAHHDVRDIADQLLKAVVQLDATCTGEE